MTSIKLGVAGFAAACLAALSISLSSMAQEQKSGSPPNAAQLRQVAVTPVFSQLVMMTIPPDFVPVFANAAAASYIQEFVPKGETVEKWSQMVTLTGARDAALNGQLSPAMFLQRIAAGFKRACPDTYAEKPLGSLKINGYDAFVALAGCGSVQSGTPRSEVAFLMAVKGSADVYTLQWAERGMPLGQAPVLDEATWKARFQALSPVRVCDRIAGEPAPYPSCVGQQPQK